MCDRKLPPFGGNGLFRRIFFSRVRITKYMKKNGSRPGWTAAGSGRQVGGLCPQNKLSGAYIIVQARARARSREPLVWPFVPVSGPIFA